MSIKEEELRAMIHKALFPLDNRELAFQMVWHGLGLFREYRSPSYYSTRQKKVTGTKNSEIVTKQIKRPLTSHFVKVGRYDQTAARTVLISAICRAWHVGFGKKPTLNHKSDPDSPFARFAIEILAKENVGHAHQHLEEYWSTRKLSQKMSI